MYIQYLLQHATTSLLVYFIVFALTHNQNMYTHCVRIYIEYTYIYMCVYIMYTLACKIIIDRQALQGKYREPIQIVLCSIIARAIILIIYVYYSRSTENKYRQQHRKRLRNLLEVLFSFCLESFLRHKSPDTVIEGIKDLRRHVWNSQFLQ